MPTLRPAANLALDAYNTLGVHSVAEYAVIAHDTDSIIAAANWAAERNLELTVLGGGSNVILKPRLPGLVLVIATRGLSLEHRGQHAILRAKAGENWHDLVRFSLGQGLNGLQNMALIPGSVGAAPVQNIGAYGSELSDVLIDVEVYDPQTGARGRLDSAECGFGYRHSRFKEARGQHLVILDVRLQLSCDRQVSPADRQYTALADELHAMGIWRPTPTAIAEAVCRVRRRKLPDPAVIGNVGSVFKNPVVSAAKARQLSARIPDLVQHSQQDGVRLAAAQLIERAGGKSLRAGACTVWPRQALVLVQQQKQPAPLATDFCALMTQIRAAVADQFDVMLEREPQLLGD